MKLTSHLPPAGVMMSAAEKSVANCSGVPNIAPRPVHKIRRYGRQPTVGATASTASRLSVLCAEEPNLPVRGRDKSASRR